MRGWRRQQYERIEDATSRSTTRHHIDISPPLQTTSRNTTHDQMDGDPSTRVYRPLLFHSKGYASSELFRDSYEMRTRIPDTTTRSDEDQMHWKYDPKIRLETLSSRAAMTVLWITYISFILAFAYPYLESRGYLETVLSLPGKECSNTMEPCIVVDTKHQIARWSAFVHNISWYAGSIEVRVEISDLINMTTNEIVSLEKHPWNASLDVVDESLALHYDISLYGIDVAIAPLSKQWIRTESNQTVWVNCHTKEKCDSVSLLQITQDQVRRFLKPSIILYDVLAG